MSSRRIVLLLAVALAGAPLGACSTVEDRPARPPVEAAAGRDNSPSRRAWRLEEEVLGQPVVTGRTAVVLVRARTDEVDVVAVDGDTGRVRWRAPYEPVINSFWAAEPYVTDGDGERAAVVFPAPAPGDDEFARLVRSVAPRSGRDLFTPPELQVVGPLRECPDGEDTCATGTDDDGYGGGPQGILRVGPSSSSVGRDYSGAPDGAYAVGPEGVFLVPGGPGNGRIGRAAEGRVLFTSTVADLVGRRYDANKGASFVRDRRSRVLVGSIAAAQPPGARTDYEADGYTVDLARQDHMVGLDDRSGELLWRAPGAADCPGTDDPTDPDARCVATGTLTATEGENDDWDLESARAEGYDPRTGRTTWAVEMSPPDRERLLDAGRTVAAPEGGPVVLPLQGGPAYVDLVDGTSSPVAAEDRFACFGRTELFGYGPDEAGDARRSGRLVTPCDAGGGRTGATLVADAVREAGTAVGPRHRDVWVLSTPDGLEGHDLADG